MGAREVCQRGLPCKIGEHSVEVCVLTDADSADFDVWVSGRFIANARASLVGVDDDVWQRTMRLAMREAIGLTWLKQPGRQVLYTIDGKAYMAWLSVKRSAPKLTFEELRKTIHDDPGALSEFYVAFAAVAGLSEEAGGKAPTNPP